MALVDGATILSRAYMKLKKRRAAKGSYAALPTHDDAGARSSQAVQVSDAVRSTRSTSANVPLCAPGSSSRASNQASTSQPAKPRSAGNDKGGKGKIAPKRMKTARQQAANAELEELQAQLAALGYGDGDVSFNALLRKSWNDQSWVKRFSFFACIVGAVLIFADVLMQEVNVFRPRRAEHLKMVYKVSRQTGLYIPAPSEGDLEFRVFLYLIAVSAVLVPTGLWVIDSWYAPRWPFETAFGPLAVLASFTPVIGVGWALLPHLEPHDLFASWTYSPTNITGKAPTPFWKTEMARRALLHPRKDTVWLGSGVAPSCDNAATTVVTTITNSLGTITTSFVTSCLTTVMSHSPTPIQSTSAPQPARTSSVVAAAAAAAGAGVAADGSSAAVATSDDGSGTVGDDGSIIPNVKTTTWSPAVLIIILVILFGLAVVLLTFCFIKRHGSGRGGGSSKGGSSSHPLFHSKSFYNNLMKARAARGSGAPAPAAAAAPTKPPEKAKSASWATKVAADRDAVAAAVHPNPDAHVVNVAPPPAPPPAVPPAGTGQQRGGVGPPAPDHRPARDAVHPHIPQEHSGREDYLDPLEATMLEALGIWIACRFMARNDHAPDFLCESDDDGHWRFVDDVRLTAMGPGMAITVHDYHDYHIKQQHTAPDFLDHAAAMRKPDGYPPEAKWKLPGKVSGEDRNLTLLPHPQSKRELLSRDNEKIVAEDLAEHLNHQRSNRQGVDLAHAHLRANPYKLPFLFDPVDNVFVHVAALYWEGPDNVEGQSKAEGAEREQRRRQQKERLGRCSSKSYDVLDRIKKFARKRFEVHQDATLLQRVFDKIQKDSLKPKTMNFWNVVSYDRGGKPDQRLRKMYLWRGIKMALKYANDKSENFRLLPSANASDPKTYTVAPWTSHTGHGLYYQAARGAPLPLSQAPFPDSGRDTHEDFRRFKLGAKRNVKVEPQRGTQAGRPDHRLPQLLYYSGESDIGRRGHNSWQISLHSYDVNESANVANFAYQVTAPDHLRPQPTEHLVHDNRLVGGALSIQRDDKDSHNLRFVPVYPAQEGTSNHFFKTFANQAAADAVKDHFVNEIYQQAVNALLLARVAGQPAGAANHTWIELQQMLLNRAHFPTEDMARKAQ